MIVSNSAHLPHIVDYTSRMRKACSYTNQGCTQLTAVTACLGVNYPISLTVNGHPIPLCETVKYLGVTLSSNLSNPNPGLTTFSQPVKLQGTNWDWYIETSTWHLLMSVILSIIVLFFHDWTIAQWSEIPTRSATKWNWRMSKNLQVELSQNNGSPPTQIYLLD